MAISYGTTSNNAPGIVQTHPGVLPARNAGDYMVAVLELSSSVVIDGPPAGWNLRGQSPDGNINHRTAVYDRYATADANDAFSAHVDSACTSEVTITTFPGGYFHKIQMSDATNTVVVPDIDPDLTGCWLVGIWGLDGGSGLVDITPPGSMTKRFQFHSGSPISCVVMATEVLPDANPPGTRTGTATAAGTGKSTAALLVTDVPPGGWSRPVGPLHLGHSGIRLRRYS